MEQQVTPAAEPSFREQVEAAEAPVETPQEVEQEAAPEPTEGEQPQETQEQKTVPLGALHEERAKRKRAEQATAQERQRMDVLQQRLEYLTQLATQQQPQPAPVPAFDVDPLTNIGHTVHQTAAELANMKREMADAQQAQQAVQRRQQFEQVVLNTEQQFAQEQPDYFEAVTWAKSKKLAEYQAVGLTESQATDRIMREVNELAWDALQRGESPAVVGYRLAQAIGYQPKQANAQQKLDMQRQGRAASTPGSSSGGGGKLSLDALAKMSGSDFLENTSGDKWKKLMGGK